MIPGNMGISRLFFSKKNVVLRRWHDLTKENMWILIKQKEWEWVGNGWGQLGKDGVNTSAMTC